LFAVLCIFSMSSFQLNLASLTLGAKEHLARLDASAGGAFRARLQSPLATASAAAHSQPPAVGAAVTFASSLVGIVAGSGAPTAPSALTSRRWLFCPVIFTYQLAEAARFPTTMPQWPCSPPRIFKPSCRNVIRKRDGRNSSRY
jgi:hypothetical protein